MKEPQLITAPCFTFSQGDIYQGSEYPVLVIYYRGHNETPMIELKQDGQEILFNDLTSLKKLVKQIEKHEAEAFKFLNK